jgi:hypothetical protein
MAGYVGGFTHERLAGERIAMKTARELEDSRELKALDAADSLLAAEVGVAPGREGGQGAGLGKELFGYAEDVAALTAVAQHDGQEFGIAESGGSQAFKSFLRTFVKGKGREALHLQKRVCRKYIKGKIYLTTI